jgi:hypothetical protein
MRPVASKCRSAAERSACGLAGGSRCGKDGLQAADYWRRRPAAIDAVDRTGRRDGLIANMVARTMPAPPVRHQLAAPATFRMSPLVPSETSTISPSLCHEADLFEGGSQRRRFRRRTVTACHWAEERSNQANRFQILGEGRPVQNSLPKMVRPKASPAMRSESIDRRQWPSNSFANGDACCRKRPSRIDIRALAPASAGRDGWAGQQDYRDGEAVRVGVRLPAAAG